MQSQKEAGAAWRTSNVGVSRHTSPSWGQARGPANSATTLGYKPNHPTLELKRCRSNRYPFGKRILIRAAASKISNPPKREKKPNWQACMPALLWIPLRDIVGYGKDRKIFNKFPGIIVDPNPVSLHCGGGESSGTTVGREHQPNSVNIGRSEMLHSFPWSEARLSTMAVFFGFLLSEGLNWLGLSETTS